MDYHAHIYWESAQQQIVALSLRELLTAIGCELGRVWNGPVGPHPLPMYQASYNDRTKQSVEKLLANSGLTVLLHEETGDALRDHTTGARWLGKQLELDLEWLKAYVDLQ